MPTEIDRREVQRQLDKRAQLVEVLPEEVYRLKHLPGAINIPLDQLNRVAAAHLRPDLPVVVYCYDTT